MGPWHVLRENYDISTPPLRAECSSSELPEHGVARRDDESNARGITSPCLFSKQADHHDRNSPYGGRSGGRTRTGAHLPLPAFQAGAATIRLALPHLTCHPQPEGHSINLPPTSLALASASWGLRNPRIWHVTHQNIALSRLCFATRKARGSNPERLSPHALSRRAPHQFGCLPC